MSRIAANAAGEKNKKAIKNPIINFFSDITTISNFQSYNLINRAMRIKQLEDN